MKDVRFYKEYDSKSDKRRDNGNGNVLAVFPENSFISQGEYLVEGIGAVYYQPDSPVCSTSVSWKYLREQTKRISEAKAREIHPELFKYLDS